MDNKERQGRIRELSMAYAHLTGITPRQEKWLGQAAEELHPGNSEKARLFLEGKHGERPEDLPAVVFVNTPRYGVKGQTPLRSAYFGQSPSEIILLAREIAGGLEEWQKYDHAPCDSSPSTTSNQWPITIFQGIVAKVSETGRGLKMRVESKAKSRLSKPKERDTKLLTGDFLKEDKRG
jgi:hypothetical protein